MKRKIIRINEDLCNGCGSCVTGCAEGALKIVNGKAKMVNEVFCDGLGACIGHCPTGALVIEERDAPDFDEKAVEEHLAKAPKAAPVHQHHHGPGGCPGMAQRQLRTDTPTATASSSTGLPDQVNPSELRQWPVQLHLVNPANPAFQNKEMVLLSTCSPIASADVHWRYLRGRSVCVACPKLDDTSPYVEKLAEILSEATIPKFIVLIMEVPCCKGLSMIAQEAAKNSGRKNLIVEEHILSLDGKIKSIKPITF